MLMAFEGSLGAPFQHGLGVKDEREIRFLGGGGDNELLRFCLRQLKPRHLHIHAIRKSQSSGSGD